MEEERELLRKKAEHFKEGGYLVHLSLKKGKTPAGFLNGTIEEVSAEFIMFKDRQKGLIPVFFLEIHKIEPYEEPLPA